MKVAVLSFTSGGDRLNAEIVKSIGGISYMSVKNVLELTKKLFYINDALIFIGAAGIAVRAVAPFVVSKLTDPAVLVCDEAGRFVIPILSGHVGGANTLAKKLSEEMNAVLVITTATDIRGLWAADSWAVKNGFLMANPENIKAISSALLENKIIGLSSDFKISGQLPKNMDMGSHEVGVAVSPYIKSPFGTTLNIVPKCITLGVGCKKNADIAELWKLFEQAGLSPMSVKTIATIDIKAEEPAIMELAKAFDAELKLYTSEELNRTVGDFTPSDFVLKTVKTDNVCERAAAAGGGKLIVKKLKGAGVTLAAAMDRLEISFEE